MQRIAGLAVLDEPRVAGLHHHAGAQVLVGRQIDMLHLRHHAVEEPVEAVRPLDALDPGRGAGLLLGQLLALPDRDVLVGLLHEEDLPLLRIDRVRHQDQRRFLLVHAGEIEEVAVLLEGHRAVGVGRIDVVGMEDDHAVRLEQSAEILAVADKKLR